MLMINIDINQLKQAVSDLEISTYKLRTMFVNPEPLILGKIAEIQLKGEYKKICEISKDIDELKKRLSSL
jgi:hypothetical protein